MAFQGIAEEMLSMAAGAVAGLRAGARAAMSDYLRSQRAPEGGFRNRGGQADLYYESFGLSASLVLDMDCALPTEEAFVDGFAAGELDLVHLSTLARSRALLRRMGGRPGRTTDEGTRALGNFASREGAFAHEAGTAASPYAIFLALGILQDEGSPVERGELLSETLRGLRHSEGRYHHPSSSFAGALLSTAAAVTSLRHLGAALDEEALSWMARQQTPSGGFLAAPESPMPDLLSTAVALYTLRSCGKDMTTVGERARPFLEDHWCDDGSFTATLLDERGDCEYLFYGLLALGALSP